MTQGKQPALTVIENDKYDVISTLEMFLEGARQGDFRCVAIAAVGAGTSITTTWSATPPGTHSSLVGALSYLQFRMNRKMDEE